MTEHANRVDWRGEDGAERRTAVVTLNGAVKRYGMHVALDGLSLAVYPGQVVALLGPNGAGKTTAIRLMLGLTTPDSGSVELFGRDPRDRNARRHVGAMLQVGVGGVPGTLTVREHINMFRSYYDRPLPVADVLRHAGIEALEGRRFGKLSGGEKQRVMLALALCGDPALLFLDEPTVGMDVEARTLLWNRIRAAAAAGKAVLLTTHYLEEADRLADRIVVIQGGRTIAAGSPADIKSAAASRFVRCRTELADEDLAALPGVGQISRQGANVTIATSDPDLTIRALVAADGDASRIEIDQASLETAFLSLTGAGERSGTVDGGPRT